MRLCEFEGCGRKHKGRGLCTGHIKQDRAGVPLRPLKNKVWRHPTAEDMFWHNVGVTEECWIWFGDKNNKGYGDLKHFSGRWLAHRFSYELLIGVIPDGLVLDHICHVADCVKPEHLRAITQKQNSEHRQRAQTNSVTGVLGVSPTASGRYRARVTHFGKAEHLGTYDTIEEAGKVVVAKRNEVFTHNSADR